MTRKALFCVLCSLALAGRHVIFADGARIFEDGAGWATPETVTVSEDELFPNPPYAHDWQSRSFLFNGRLDDGTFFLINLFRWQFSFLHSWGLQVLITDTSGRLFKYDGRLPDEVKKGQSPTGFHHRFGGNEFTSTGSDHRVKLNLPGFSCDLRIKNLLPAWKPGDGWAYFDATHTAYVHYTVPCPLATVSGSMLSFGNLRSVSGMCTWDSGLYVQPLSRPDSPQYSLRAFDASEEAPEGSLFVDMVQYFTNASYGSAAIPVLIVARGSTWLFTTKDFTLVPSGWTSVREPPYSFPTSYRLSAAGRGWKLEGQFASSRMYSETDVFQEIPPVIRGFVSLFLKRPVLYRMVGELHGLLKSPDGSESTLSMPAHAEYIVVE